MDAAIKRLDGTDGQQRRPTRASRVTVALVGTSTRGPHPSWRPPIAGPPLAADDRARHSQPRARAPMTTAAPQTPAATSSSMTPHAARQLLRGARRPRLDLIEQAEQQAADDQRRARWAARRSR